MTLHNLMGNDWWTQTRDIWLCEDEFDQYS